MRREFLARLVARISATSAGPAWPGVLSLPNNLGISAGSLCPSPSIVAIFGLRAAKTPVLTAALWPDITEPGMVRNKGFDFVARVIGTAVVDDDHITEDVSRQDPIPP